MKTPEELNALKEEVEALNKKLAELTGEELQQIIGGSGESYDIYYEILKAITKFNNAERAKLLFRHYYTELNERERSYIRMIFERHFGYPID